jgi:ubiquinone/menaquinone biosynthesis C-methylase UbiE
MESVRAAYGAMAAQYIELFGSSVHVAADDLDLIARHLTIRPGTVLDVGCGPGHLTDHLCSLDVDATGIDVVPEFIEHARAAYPEGRYVLGSMHRLPVPDHSIDGILAWYSLIHVPPNDFDSVLSELRRVIAPRGTLVVGFFNADDVMAFKHKVLTAYYWTVDELSDRLRRAGFAETLRQRRPGVPELGRRAHAAIVAVAN